MDRELLPRTSIAANDPSDNRSKGDGARYDRYVYDGDLGHVLFRFDAVQDANRKRSSSARTSRI